MRRLSSGLLAGAVAALVPGPVLACGGLVAPNGTINLLRTTTLAAYHDGVEHYVTSFEFAGGGAEFGSITPLPGVPTRVVKGGDWTLQRLVRETQPAFAARRTSAGGEAVALNSAIVLSRTRIDALDITILEGGGTAVGNWAREHGFDLPPDAPEVLDFYARRSPIFMAAVFDPAAAARRGQGVGDGTPVHLTIPTDRPWVPLRILGLGRRQQEPVGADVFLLTDERPALLPAPGGAGSGAATTLQFSGPASVSLLRDLRGDRGMKWLPTTGMWLTHLAVDERAGALRHDLAIHPTGGEPSPVDAGLRPAFAPPQIPAGADPAAWAWVAALAAGALMLVAADRAARRVR